MLIKFSLPTTTQCDNGGLSPLARYFEIAHELVHVGAGRVAVAAPHWVAKVHDCVFGCVTEKASGL